MATDYYDILGVSRDASAEDIKKAFRTLARQYHPDATGNDPEASERYKRMSEAYAVLSDPSRRRGYDLSRSGIFGGAGGAGSPFATTIEDLFDSFFGGSGRRTGERRTRARDGESLEVELELDFREAIFGKTETVRIRRFESCERCGGEGAEPGTNKVRCNRCDGTGQLQEVRRSVFGNVVTAYPCTACAQTGQVILDPCRDCRGAGRVPGEADVQVDVPAGVETGDRLRIRGGGSAGAEGGAPGDLYVRFAVPGDDRFERVGDELATWVEVPMTTAALGGEVVFESLDGEERITLPRGTQSGALFRIRGRGVPRRQGRSRGDLLARVQVTTPTDLDDEQETLLRKLADLRREEAEPGRGILGRLRRALGLDED